MTPKLDEVPQPGQTPEDYTKRMSTRKINAILDLLRGRIPNWICGADTVIAVDGDIFGKPHNREQAKAMLERLRGREHAVYTAVALFNGRTQSTDCRAVRSSVSFAAFSEDELEWYLNTGEWQGVAGAYRIQGLGACFISAITGSFSAIVGLPMREFYSMLLDNGYPYYS